MSKVGEHNICPVSKVREYKVCPVFKVGEYRRSLFCVQSQGIRSLSCVQSERITKRTSAVTCLSKITQPSENQQLWPLLSWTPPVLHRETDILSNTSNLTSTAALQASSVNTVPINSAVVSHRLKDTEEGELHSSSTSSQNTAAVSSEYRDLYVLAERLLAQRYFGCSQLLERVS